MALYAYRARNEQGGVVQGSLAAASEDELAQALSAARLYLVAAKPDAGKSPGFKLFQRVRRQDLIAFSTHVALSLSAGVPLLEALRDLETRCERRGLKEVLGRVRVAVQGGATFSEALAQAPEAFPDLYVAIVRTGEATGRLDVVLKDLAGFLEWQDDLSSKVRQATYYPVAVLVAVMALTALLMGFVFPRFMTIFERTNIELPLPTRIVMGVSHVFTGYWPLLVLAVVGAVVGFKLAKKRPEGRLVIDRLKVRLPIFGELIAKVALSRFSHYLETMLRGGVEIMRALEVTETVVGNEVFARSLAQARHAVATGRPLSEALEQTGRFPHMVVRLVGLGELSGQLDETLALVNAQYDREIPATIKKVFAVFEPVVIAVLAAVVLGMALSMFLPLYEMLNAVSKGAV